MRYKNFKEALITAFVFLFFLCPAVSGFPQPYGGCTATDRTLFLTTPRISGEDVVELQERLTELGYYAGRINGIFDETTCQAVKKLQKDFKMNPTGEVGLQTWKVMAAGIKAPPVAADTSDKKITPEKLSILIDTNKKTLVLIHEGKPYKTFPCAVGKPETPTPVGEWTIIHKGGNWGDGFGDRWMGLNVPWGIYGIHGTNKPYSIGTAASHGCIRMFNEHVRYVYSMIQEGTPVKIVGDPKMPPAAKFRKSMKDGASGPDVVQVQLALKEQGFLMGNADGRFGPGTELAVRFFQVREGMKDSGVVEAETYSALGIDLAKY